MPTTANTASNRIASGRAAVPVVRNLDAVVSAGERRRLAGIAAKLLRDEPALNRTDVFGAQVRAGLGGAPAVLFGDQREIGLHEDLPEQALEHRIAFLAATGDLVVVERACPAWERYLAGLLGIGALEVVEIGPPRPGRPVPAASRCREPGPVLARLTAAAAAAGELQVIPHIGAGSAWVLAGAIARGAGVPVAVAAAPPRLTRRVNDKIWFADCVRAVLGPGAVPPGSAAFGPAAVAARIARLAGRARRVIVKTPDSAGSMGNVAVDAALIRGQPLRRIRDLVLAMLRGRGWRGGFPLLVGVWEVDAVASPSVQIWIPTPAQGDPVIEGIFEQRLAGPEAEFVGAVPTTLPGPLRNRMAGEALRLALLLQRLGYFGRCSLDALVTGSVGTGAGAEAGAGAGAGAGAAAGLRWLECNGRWGGVSVPMTFLNRMFGNHAGCGLVIVQDHDLPLAAAGVDAVFVRLGPLLLRRGDREGVVPLSAGYFERGRGAHLLAVAATQPQAEALAREAVARLAASSPGLI